MIGAAPPPEPRHHVAGERMRAPRGILPPMCPLHWGNPKGACGPCVVEMNRPRSDRADMLSARRGRHPYRAGP